MSGHTKGPWVARQCADRNVLGRVSSEIFGADGRTSLARVHSAKKEADANARLISAAPDLLKALKDLIEHVDRPAIAHLSALKDLRDAVRKADSAIAKAEGGAS